MQKRIATVGILLYEGGRILLVRHTKYANQPTGVYNFPAGKIDPGETPDDAAIRELKEETGLVTNHDSIYKILEKENTIQLKTGPCDMTLQLFLCLGYSGELKSSKETMPEFVEIERVGDLYLVNDDVIELSRKYHNYDPSGKP